MAKIGMCISKDGVYAYRTLKIGNCFAIFLILSDKTSVVICLFQKFARGLVAAIKCQGSLGYVIAQVYVQGMHGQDLSMPL